MGIISNKGKSNKGSRAVTEIDTASLSHQITIHKATAMTASPSLLIRGVGNKSTIKNNIGPKKSPRRLLVFISKKI